MDDNHLINTISKEGTRIESWFRKQFILTESPFYASVDLRNSGYKIAPVDTNLFPAGFNNLSLELIQVAVSTIKSAIRFECPGADGVLIIPENHTRNLGYLESLNTLANLIASAGYEVRIGSLILEEAEELVTESGKTIKIEPIVRLAEGKQVNSDELGLERIGVGDFFPCAVLLNNDLSAGRPEILEGLDQTLLPPLHMGWNDRLKSSHFKHYQEVSAQFAELLGIDSWFINPFYSKLANIDFKNEEDVKKIADEVDKLIDLINKKYQEYNIKDEPVVFIKADKGTYGMAVISVKSGKQVLEFNRKDKKKMGYGKNNIDVSHLMLQEGVYTREKSDQVTGSLEPVVYMIHENVIGGFYRVNKEKGEVENLNSQGMAFSPLSFEYAGVIPSARNKCQSKEVETKLDRIYTYGVIARLALLAAAREIDKVH